MIVLLVPTRARPSQFARMCQSAYATASNKDNIKIIAASNGGDKYAGNQFPIDTPTVHIWNMLAQEAMKDEKIKLFMLAADDIIFSTPHWDKEIIDHYDKLENKVHVYALRDSRDVGGTPHPIVSREFINALGYFVPPIFMHWFVDTWTVAIANSSNFFTHFRGFELIHEKPSDKGQPDETHLRIRQNGWHARDTYVNETCQHFLEQEKLRISFARYPKREWKIMKPGDTVDVLYDPTMEERGLEFKVRKL